MSDPRRTLIDAARDAEPSAADRARIRAALIARLGASAFPSSPREAPSPAPTPGPAPAAPGALLKLLVGGVLLGALGFGAGLLAGRPAAPRPMTARHGVEAEALRRALALERASRVEGASPVLSGSTSALLAPASPPPQGSEPAPRPPPRSARSPAPLAAAGRSPAPEGPPALGSPVEEPAQATAQAPRSLLEETEALRRAQTALREGDAARALNELESLAARHPDGLLREERQAAHVLALCAAGRVGDARSEADRFLAETPASIQARRVRASCAFGTLKAGVGSR